MRLNFVVILTVGIAVFKAKHITIANAPFSDIKVLDMADLPDNFAIEHGIQEILGVSISHSCSQHIITDVFDFFIQLITDQNIRHSGNVTLYSNQNAGKDAGHQDHKYQRSTTHKLFPISFLQIGIHKEAL